MIKDYKTFFIIVTLSVRMKSEYDNMTERLFKSMDSAT